MKQAAATLAASGSASPAPLLRRTTTAKLPPLHNSAFVGRQHSNIGFSSSRRIASPANKRWDQRNARLAPVAVVSAKSRKSEEEMVIGSGRKVAELGLLFALWIIFNIYFNIYNKQVFPYPATMTTVQFSIGTFLVLLVWSMNLLERPRITMSQFVAILPMAVVHTLGNFFTNMSLGSVAVSFTHTIKAMEPFFSVILSAMFLGQKPNILVVASLLPIVGGVVLASFTEASFNWTGFWSAMASNLANQSRNVLSKKLMVQKEESLDDIALFSIITVLSFFLSIPVTLFVDGFKITPSFVQSIGFDLREIYTRSILAGLCFHTYQQVAYMILARVSPITLSVGNCVKRVVVIISAILFFRNPISPINSLGTAIALAGVFIYSRVKQ